MASTALARRISPVHTPFDGDVVFGLSTAEEARAVDPARLLALGVSARRVLEESITGAVRDWT
jgi:L-aminopeptidase/D-esterase-like protein